MTAQEARALMPQPIDDINVIFQKIKTRSESAYDFCYESVTKKVQDQLELKGFAVEEIRIPQRNGEEILFRISW